MMMFDAAALLTELNADKLEALVDTMVLAADADGELATEELRSLAVNIENLAKGTPHEVLLSGKALVTRLETGQSRVSDGKRALLIDSVKTRLPHPDDRKAALGLAIVVAAADGIVRTSEREVIMELAEALDVDRDVAADLVRDITRG